jgi:hypothetical protein
MTYLVRFHTDAEVEMNEAAEYLNRESTGLGEVFLDDLRHAIDLVASHPEIAPTEKGRVRRKASAQIPLFAYILHCRRRDPHSCNNASTSASILLAAPKLILLEQIGLRLY